MKVTAKEEKIEHARSEIKNIYQAFLQGEGRLPNGFSFKYNKTLSSGHISYGTPFDTYLDKIWAEVDMLKNVSGISDWIYMSGEVDINTAAAAIVEWAKQQRDMTSLLRKKCHIDNTTIMLPVNPYCTAKIMIVIDDECRFEDMTEKSIQSCKATDISFCKVLSDCKLFDLIEQKEKEVVYVTYPNYHDETYGNWNLR